MIQKIIDIALHTDLKGEPEIDVIDGIVSLYDYREDYEQAFHVEDICKSDKVNLYKLKKELDNHSIAYVI